MAAKPMRGSWEQNEAKRPWNVEPPLVKKCSKYTLSPRRRSRNGVTRMPRTVRSRNRRSNPSTKISSTLGRPPPRPWDRSSRTPGPPVAPWTSGYRDDGNVAPGAMRSEEHTSELQSLAYLVCRLLLEKKKNYNITLA